MQLLYSNILPLGIEEDQKTIIDAFHEQLQLADRVEIAVGYTSYASLEELDNLIDKANLVISHGGVGSMITANQKGKKVIAVPRYKKYHEHVNDHQVETIEIFAKRGYVFPIENVEQLEDALKKIEDFEPIQYQRDEKSNVLEIIENFIG